MINYQYIPFTITNIDIIPTNIQLHLKANLINPEHYLISSDNKTYCKLLDKYHFRLEAYNYNDRIVTIILRPTESIFLKYNGSRKINNKLIFPINNIFPTKGKVKLSGNINSLIFKDFTNIKLPIPSDIYANLFNPVGHLARTKCISIEDASNLILPGENLHDKCYAGLFAYNTSLKYPPKELPAKHVPEYAYNSMFNSCSELISIPNIKGETFAYAACLSMFERCKNLKDIYNFPNKIKLASSHSLCSTFSECPISIFPKKLFIKQAQINTCQFMFYNHNYKAKDIPLDFLLSLNLDISQTNTSIIERLRKYVRQVYCIELFKDLTINTFQKKISVFKYYRHFRKTYQRFS